MSQKYKDTIDWDLFWEHETESKEMIKGAENMAKRISTFIERYNINSIADFGCGKARTLFMLAEKYPDLEFSGFDPSIPVIKQNRLKAKEVGVSNIRFDFEMLPSIESKETFDLVFCIATLHYIRDIKKGIKNLFAHINPEGFLIFNYPNRYSMFAYRDWVKNHEGRKKRFSLVLNGKNLLTVKEIEKVLGKKPKNFWTAVGEETNRANMCVYLEKR